MKPRILIVGSNFAGLHAAFELHHTLGDEADVAIIAPEDNFVFLPSLIWVVTGRCSPKRISFDLRTALEPRGITFKHQTVEKIDLDNNKVITDMASHHYDYLVIATGATPDWSVAPGLGPHHGYTHYVCSVPWATNANNAWKRYLREPTGPGPIVVGATQNSGCYGLAYEMILNLEYALRRNNKRKGVPMTFITSEPYIGHLGMGGVGNSQEVVERVFKKYGIEWVTNVAVKEALPDEIRLEDGRSFPFKYSIFMAPFKGRQFVFDSPGLGNDRGFIPVNDRYQHINYKNVFAAGVAVAVQQPEKTAIPVGVPKTGYMSDIMGKVAAKNIEAEVMGKKAYELPFPDIKLICVMDGGDHAISLYSDRIFPPRKKAIVKDGPIWHLSKIMFEKYYMWKVRTGRVYLP